MLLEGKKILIMGIRNKWSIAFGIAQSVYENGGKLIFTYRGENNKEKVKELVSEFKGSKIYALDDASDDEQVKSVFENIKEENGKIDGIVHSIVMQTQKTCIMILYIQAKTGIYTLWKLVHIHCYLLREQQKK